MMGRNHAALGAGAFAGTAWVATHYLGLGPLSLAQVTLGVVVAAGAALAPDIDEPHSLAGRDNPMSLLGYPVLRRGRDAWTRCWLAWRPLFGAHRCRTHYLVAVAGVALAALVCSWSRPAGSVLVGVAACTGGGALSRRLAGAGWLLCIPFGVTVGYGCWRWVPGGWWLWAAVAVPYASHLLGDAMTPHGVPFWGPWNRHCYSMHLFRSGQSGERLIVTPLVHLAAGWAAYQAFAPTISGAVSAAAGRGLR